MNMRKTIEKYGGEVRFNSRVRDIIIEQNRVKGVVTGDEEIRAEHVILATGHSARDAAEGFCRGASTGTSARVN